MSFIRQILFLPYGRIHGILRFGIFRFFQVARPERVRYIDENAIAVISDALTA